MSQSEKKIIGKSSQNSPILELIFWRCVFCLYTGTFLLKVVTYYDLRVPSMSVMCLKNKFGWGVGGG